MDAAVDFENWADSLLAVFRAGDQVAVRHDEHGKCFLTLGSDACWRTCGGEQLDIKSEDIGFLEIHRPPGVLPGDYWVRVYGGIPSGMVYLLFPGWNDPFPYVRVRNPESSFDGFHWDVIGSLLFQRPTRLIEFEMGTLHSGSCDVLVEFEGGQRLEDVIFATEDQGFYVGNTLIRRGRNGWVDGGTGENCRIYRRVH